MRPLAILALPLMLGCVFSGPGTQAGPGRDAGDGDGDVDGDAGADAAIDAGPTAWADADYNRRRPIVIVQTDPALDGFPVPIALNLNSQGAVGEDGAGLLFVDNDNAILPHEIEQLDTMGNGIVWVRVDLTGPGSTRLWVYYDKTGQRALNNDGAGVFAGFAGVYHFSDDLGSNGAEDSVGDNELDDISNVDNGDHEAGAFALAVDYTAADTERLRTSESVPAFVLGDDGQLLFEAWVLADALTGRFAFLDTVETNGASLEIDGDFVRADVELDTTYLVTGDDVVDDNVWHHVAWQVDRSAGTARLYVDGVFDGEVTGLPDTGDVGGGQLAVGGRNSSGNPRFFTGRIDEVRVGPARPVAWIEATAEGTDLAAVGNEERQP